MSVIPDPPAIDESDLESGISACAGDNPCEAGWQTAYAYAADQAYKLAIYQALQGVVFGAAQFSSADRTADLQYDISNRQMAIAEEEYARYKNTYVDCEDALASEICNMTCPEIDYDFRADRALRDVRKQYGEARKKLARTRNRYCMADMVKSFCDIEKAEALAVVQARDIAYRYDEKRHDFLNQRHWERRVVVLQHGRNIMSGQSSIYNSGATGAQQALGAGQDARDNLLGTISGAIGGILNARANLPQQVKTPGAVNPLQSSVPSPGGIATSSVNGLQSGIAG